MGDKRNTGTDVSVSVNLNFTAAIESTRISVGHSSGTPPKIVFAWRQKLSGADN